MKVVRKISSLISIIATIFCLGVIATTIFVFALVFYFSTDLPDYTQLAHYNPPTVTRLYASDGKIVAEYAKEKRLFVPIKAIPKKLVNAFIAAEDKNFYHHPGVDFLGIVRAAIQNLINLGTNKSLVGGSTITQQVVKNFLLSNEKSIDRKVKEAILAFRITQAFPKDRIMELYLNEIYLGNRSYGVAAAALNYFNKSIDELTIEESALLAALPKAPSSLDPIRHEKKAKQRRDWVIERMRVEGFISDIDAMIAISTPIKIASRDSKEFATAEFFADAVKKQLEEIYSHQKVLESGLAVHTTLKPDMQEIAEKALIRGLGSYDKRHGWRGALVNLEDTSNWYEQVKEKGLAVEVEGLHIALVVDIDKDKAFIELVDGKQGTIPLKYLKWAKKYIDRDELGPTPTKPADVLSSGDVVLVRKRKKDLYFLEQVPEINGALVAMDPHNGRVFAMAGGYNYQLNQFNRATQAKRQPGSAFKPFVYLAALENGFAPNTIIVDDEVQLEQGENLPGWRPQNYSGEYYGSTTLRVGVEKSRNAMTVRLSQLMGIDKVMEVAKRFNISQNPARNFSVALGSAETSLLDLTAAYAALVSGGKRISPSLIEKIQDNTGKIIYKTDMRNCDLCSEQITRASSNEHFIPPYLEDMRQNITDPITSYQIVSMLEGVVQRGTGRRAKNIGKTLAGKTGTTNDSFDAWFVGFTADLAVGVYVGFDTPQSLGKRETGASAALPIWHEFMKRVLKDQPDIPFRRPAGVKLVKIDAQTGLLPSPSTNEGNIIYEAFKAGTEPRTVRQNDAGTGPSEDNDFEVREIY